MTTPFDVIVENMPVWTNIVADNNGHIHIKMPPMKEIFTAAKRIEDALEAAGYKIVKKK